MKRIIKLSLIAIFVIIFFHPLLVKAEKCAYAKGDWVIRGEQNCSDNELIIDGNIYILPESQLKLSNVTLLFNPSFKGKGIVNDGSLIIQDSVLCSYDGGAVPGYGFLNNPGSKLQLWRNNITDFGWFQHDANWKSKSIFLNTDEAIIKGNIFLISGYDNGQGLFLYEANNNLIENNVFETQAPSLANVAIYLVRSKKNTIKNNNILIQYADEIGIYLERANNNEVIGNKIKTTNQEDQGMDIEDSNNNLFVGNQLDIQGDFSSGLRFRGSNNNFVKNNSITTYDYESHGVYLDGCCERQYPSGLVKNNLFTHNLIVTYENASYSVLMKNAPNTTFTQNYFKCNKAYCVYNDQPEKAFFEDNYWGTDNANNIQEKIYDVFDDVNKGEVEFAPFLRKAPETIIAENDEYCKEWSGCSEGEQYQICYFNETKIKNIRKCNETIVNPFALSDEEIKIRYVETYVPIENNATMAFNFTEFISTVKSNIKKFYNSKIAPHYVFSLEKNPLVQTKYSKMVSWNKTTLFVIRADKEAYLVDGFNEQNATYYKGNASFRKILNLILNFQQENFFNMTRPSPHPLPDLPYVVISQSKQQKTKSIFNYLDVGPPELMDLQNALNNLRKNITWTEVNISKDVCEGLYDFYIDPYDEGKNINTARLASCYEKIRGLKCEDFGLKFKRNCYQQLNENEITLHLLYDKTNEANITHVNDEPFFNYTRTARPFENNLDENGTLKTITLPALIHVHNVSVKCQIDVPVCDDRPQFAGINISQINLRATIYSGFIMLENLGQQSLRGTDLQMWKEKMNQSTKEKHFELERDQCFIRDDVFGPGAECQIASYDFFRGGKQPRLDFRYLNHSLNICFSADKRACRKPQCSPTRPPLCEPPDQLINLKYVTAENLSCTKLICVKQNFKSDCAEEKSLTDKDVCYRKKGVCIYINQTDIRDNCYFSQAQDKNDAGFCDQIISPYYRELCEDLIFCSGYNREDIDEVDHTNEYVVQVRKTWLRSPSRCRELYLFKGDCRYYPRKLSPEEKEKRIKKYSTDKNGLFMINKKDISYDITYTMAFTNETPCQGVAYQLNLQEFMPGFLSKIS